jgi:3-hydroxyisobutyrate dehydrogenase-like beta-hydroxyacid dehydrogenase
MKLGIAGLGRMGVPMAKNLINAGFDIQVWNRNPARSASFATEMQCQIAQTPEALASACDIVITMLADDAASQDVYLGESGLLKGKKAMVFIEMSTVSPNWINRLQSQSSRAAIIDAPVSGATQAAQAGKLMIMVGGSEEIAQPLLPIFDALGEKTIILGKQSAGATMKLAINSVIHSLNQAAAESLNLAQAAGIELPLAYEALEASAACAPMLRYRKPLYLDEQAHQVTFTVGLAAKDVDLATRLAQTLDVQMPQAELNLDILNQASQKGYVNRDMASVISYLKKEHT